jgi:hypothetical protein
MITVDHEVLIRVPPAEVFEFVTNAENDNAWVGFTLSTGKLSVAPIGWATRFHQTGAILGTRIPLVWEITAFEPGKRMRGEAISGPAKFWGEYIVQEVPFGTRVRKMSCLQFEQPFQVFQVPLQRLLEEAAQYLGHLQQPI